MLNSELSFAFYPLSELRTNLSENDTSLNHYEFEMLRNDVWVKFGVGAQ